MDGREEERYNTQKSVPNLVHQINARSNADNLDLPLRHNTFPKVPEVSIDRNYREQLRHASPYLHYTEPVPINWPNLRRVRNAATPHTSGHKPWRDIKLHAPRPMTYVHMPFLERKSQRFSRRSHSDCVSEIEIRRNKRPFARLACGHVERTANVPVPDGEGFPSMVEQGDHNSYILVGPRLRRELNESEALAEKSVVPVPCSRCRWGLNSSIAAEDHEADDAFGSDQASVLASDTSDIPSSRHPDTLKLLTGRRISQELSSPYRRLEDSQHKLPISLKANTSKQVGSPPNPGIAPQTALQRPILTPGQPSVRPELPALHLGALPKPSRIRKPKPSRSSRIPKDACPEVAMLRNPEISEEPRFRPLRVLDQSQLALSLSSALEILEDKHLSTIPSSDDAIKKPKHDQTEDHGTPELQQRLALERADPLLREEQLESDVPRHLRTYNSNKDPTERQISYNPSIEVPKQNSSGQKHSSPKPFRETIQAIPPTESHTQASLHSNVASHIVGRHGETKEYRQTNCSSSGTPCGVLQSLDDIVNEHGTLLHEVISMLSEARPRIRHASTLTRALMSRAGDCGFSRSSWSDGRSWPYANGRDEEERESNHAADEKDRFSEHVQRDDMGKQKIQPAVVLGKYYSYQASQPEPAEAQQQGLRDVSPKPPIYSSESDSGPQYSVAGKHRGQQSSVTGKMLDDYDDPKAFAAAKRPEQGGPSNDLTYYDDDHEYDEYYHDVQFALTEQEFRSLPIVIDGQPNPTQSHDNLQRTFVDSNQHQCYTVVDTPLANPTLDSIAGRNPEHCRVRSKYVAELCTLIDDIAEQDLGIKLPQALGIGSPRLGSGRRKGAGVEKVKVGT